MNEDDIKTALDEERAENYMNNLTLRYEYPQSEEDLFIDDDVFKLLDALY